MRSRSMVVRLWVVVVVLLSGTVCLHAMSHGEPIIPREPLANLPETIGNWTGREISLDPEVLKVVAVTDYVNRSYFSPTQLPVELYVGYYADQRTGDTIHSPKNCLPGAGWDPIQSDYATISLPGGRQAKVNEYVIAQGLDRELVFYWYQGRGRVTASEYMAKFWMISDAITRNRTDGALVRLITPIVNNDTAQAHARLEKFTSILFPSLSKLIPN